MYIIADGTLICFKSNLFTDDEEIYDQAEELILKHQDKIEHTDLAWKMHAFNMEYQILTSVKGVFKGVIYNMTNPDGDEA